MIRKYIKTGFEFRRYLILALPFAAIIFVAAACGTAIPGNAEETISKPDIYPDYTSVTIPYNIAPLNFKIQDRAEQYITVLKGERGGEVVIKGNKVDVSLKKWKSLMGKNKDASYTVEIYLKQDGLWKKMAPVKNFISGDKIDEYLSYRIIEPGYAYYGNLYIEQRDMTNFDKRDIFNNNIYTRDKSRACINCHAFQNYGTRNMQFHARGEYGGTIMVVDGEPRKVNIKTEGLISGGVYPAWHPKENLIAYSVNTTGQIFHSKDSQKVEVQDQYSDLILYDVEKNEAVLIEGESDELETFPAWSPDGKELYYASATYIQKLPNRSQDVVVQYKDIKYNLYKRSFDSGTREFGPPEIVYDAAAEGKSATFPRISPDGRYLLFTLGDYGTFHIWHKSSDLYIMDLSDNNVREFEEANSPDVESYHSWSSNGRWIVYSSRRDDGSYTRPYIIHFGENDKAGKPFILPEKDPDFYGRFLKSYNIPEFMVEPVTVSVKEFASVLSKDAEQASMSK